MTVRLLQGDCRVTLPTLEAGSVQSVITSPPYYGLRDYGTPPLVWGQTCCDHPHEWETVVKPAANGIINSGMQGETLNGTSGTRKPSESRICTCGAWLGNLGLEPSPELYIEHVVECFRHVRRVLRDDGVLWLNLGIRTQAAARVRQTASKARRRKSGHRLPTRGVNKSQIKAH